MANSTMEPKSSLSPPSSVNPSNDFSYGVPKDLKFWCIIFSLALSVLLTAVEFVGHRSSFLCLFLKRLSIRTFKFTDLLDFHRRGAPGDHP